MRILRRGVGEVLTVAGNVSVKILKVRGDTVRVASTSPNDKPVYRNAALEQLSAAAKEALTPPSPGPIDKNR